MTTKRQKSAGTASAGFHYVSGIVTRANCIIQKVDADNDQGNDAYIEFISKRSGYQSVRLGANQVGSFLSP